MPESGTNRRAFLKRAGVAGFACLVPGLSHTARAAQSPLVRRGINAVAADPVALAELRAAFLRIRELPPEHPFSLVFQANIHWRPFFPDYVYTQASASTDPAAQLFRDKTGFLPNPYVFDQCPHSNWWFLPWHRAYLYYFERILRWAVGSTTLTLPYWNYADPTQRELPLVFRMRTTNGMPGGPPNPLYLPPTVTFTDPMGGMQVFPMRDGPMNQGLTQLTQAAANADALKVVPFTTSPPTVPDQGFGSPRACDPTCSCAAGALERIPHNRVHVALGGSPVAVGGGLRGGFMGTVETAARDPIFWLHHCQIDRLWESWVMLGNGRENPTESDWLNAEFTFFDVGSDGKPVPVTIAAKDLLSTATLGYTYAQLEPLPPAPMLIASLPGARTFRPLAETPAPKKLVAGAHAMGPTGVALSNTAPKTVNLPMAAGVTAEQFRAAAAGPGEKGELLLAVEGIEFEYSPGVDYEVYLNLPKETPPAYDGPYYVGTLTLFGLKHPARTGHAARHVAPSVSFSVPAALRNGLDPAKLAVTFVPRTGTEPVRGRERPPAPESRTAVTVRQVRLTYAK